MQKFYMITKTKVYSSIALVHSTDRIQISTKSQTKVSFKQLDSQLVVLGLLWVKVAGMNVDSLGHPPAG